MLGRSFVLLAIGFAAWAAIAGPASTSPRAGFVVVRPDLLRSARRAMLAAAMSLTAAAVVLWYALFTRDFSIAYVALETSRAQQPWYTFSAFWAGMDGSMLLWCWILSLFAAAMARSRTAEAFIPWALPALGGALVFFGAMTAGPTNPFRASELVPLDGRGMNPLLMSPGMLIHPPVLYTGYVGLVVPFAIVVSALVTGRTGAEWVRAVRRWTLIPWLALGGGMVLGGAWAYTELGWGGYWGWDPVENAALIPWLLATAFLHSAVIQERRGMLRIWNVFLVTAAADLAIFGTFLTRSGLLSSVHTFTESPLGRWYFGFLATQTLVGLGLMAWRLDGLRSRASLESPLSKESGFLLNNVVFVAAAAAVLWGTALPLVTEALGRERLSVGPPFFNRLMAPIGCILLVLAAVGPLLPYRRGSAATLARRLRRPALAATAVAVVAVAVTRRPAFAGVAFVAALTGSVSVLETISAARAQRGGSLRRLLSRNPRRYGGYLIHLGVAVMCVGFAGSLFRTQAEVTAKPGERFAVAGYTFGFRSLERSSAADKDVRMAVLDLERGGRVLATLRPQQNVHLNFDQPQSEIAIRTTPREDVYVILAGTRADSDEAAFRVYINPLVLWVWAGAVVALLGGLVALLGGIGTRRMPAARAPAQREEVVGSTS